MPAAVDFQRKVFETLMESQWWPAEKLLAYQRIQLRRLLHHAKANAPFYAHRFDAVLKPDGDVDWDRWSEIPIVKRRDMLDHRAAMHARIVPPGHGPASVSKTSGSTSLPIEITTNQLQAVASNAARWRSHDWSHLVLSRDLAIRLGSTTAPLGPPYAEQAGLWGPAWLPRRGKVWQINVHLPVEKVIEFFRMHDIIYLNAAAAPAHVLALETERLGIAVPKLAAVLAQGASVEPGDRAAVLRVFGAPIIETYSSKEGGQMAHPCEHGRLHISAENCLVEVVDDEGRQVPTGQSGRVVVTPFFSSVQPLIRYEQGDIARPGGRCPCGRVLPTLEAIEGRFSLFFTHPDGRRKSSLVPEEGRTALDCTFWQVAQVGPLTFEIRYVPNDWNRVGDEDEFRRIFRAQYFEDAEVRLKRLREIPLSASGKFVEYKVEMERPPEV